ncbi:hypothetical protein BW687_010170 [Pseudomonas graminis]|uniref:hypothetical protein n=1 Tax=Pseudomonas graminis TaxID=158627 RepID=UPI00234B4ADB|nr:hypothetical protein [Pseudomonas graminis]MDC6380537.1 hypothetical protein [Pseudomonas graminis]
MSRHQVLVPLVTPLDAHANVCRQSVKQLVRACAPVVALEGQRLLKAMDNDKQLNHAHAWQGICMGRLITNHAFDQAVYKAQSIKIGEGVAHA